MAATYTVLVVERTDLLRRITRRILRERGYSVLEAADAEQALEVLGQREHPVDLVLIGAVGTLERSGLQQEWSANSGAPEIR